MDIPLVLFLRNVDSVVIFFEYYFCLIIKPIKPEANGLVYAKNIFALKLIMD